MTLVVKLIYAATPATTQRTGKVAAKVGNNTRSQKKLRPCRKMWSIGVELSPK